jgi:hypothetical protein
MTPLYLHRQCIYSDLDIGLHSVSDVRQQDVIKHNRACTSLLSMTITKILESG